ncbi:MAG: serine/threonine protein kinase [Candidatus Eisenbacteria bacterium]|uniref:Serine/threonine protein kinase n=1 Tax=Eiseniibacteriota bacterium TaxID=2212470 RepID=A0A849SHE9_UNCEI|nr:serine/threonine protein kinase [Candidatus Eisenbacteria bacterium]
MARLIPARLLAALRPNETARQELPGEMIRESRHRVRVAAALGAMAYTAFLIFEASGVVASNALEHRIDLTHDVLGVGICSSLLAIASLRAVSDRGVLFAALSAEWILSTVISIAVPWASFERTGHAQSLTWVVPILILFALLVPVPPRRALMISILCAATMPIGLAFLAFGGRVVVHASEYWASLLTGSIAVAIASSASRTVYRAGRQIAAAQTVGSYELLERLGEGGMGEVWKARHLLLARPAAVKLILPERLQGAQEQRESAVSRFTREAQVTAGLRSPHTVELFDFGVSGDGALYYAMELLDGLTLQHFVYRYGPVEPRRAVHWLQQACHSLGEAHAQALTHRDIKPANLFLCRYGRDVDFLKVLDFGLTKPTVPQPDQGLTTPGIAVGTPGYMAPEQVFGLQTSPATDLYALGCVAYWLLAGVKPFEADSGGELLRLHAQESPPRLSLKAAQSIPPRLESVIMACLSKDPAARPRDADALSHELSRSLDDAPWTSADAQSWWQSYPSK